MKRLGRRKALLVSLTSISVLTVAATILVGTRGVKTLKTAAETSEEYCLRLNWTTINEATDPAGALWGKQVQSNPLTLRTENGNPITFSSSNNFMEYANASHGSVIGNGAQLAADFYNTTAITGLKRIEFQVWWDWTSAATWDGQKNVKVTFASDSSFTTNKEVNTVYKEAEAKVTSTETYIVSCDDTASYFKLDCGDVFGFKYFKYINIYYSCKPALERKTISMTADWAKSLGKFSGAMGTFSLTSSDSSTIGMQSNSWLEYAPDGWGCFCTNGQHWDAEMHNTTALGAIKKIEFKVWFSIFNAATRTDDQMITITTAQDANFTEGVVSKSFVKSGLMTESGHDTFSYKVEGNPKYFKVGFGESADNAGFHGIEYFYLTYTD